MNSRIGKRVKIIGGLSEFIGKTGEIVGVEKWGHSPAMYRVLLDKPVNIAGVGVVGDDLWEGRLLKTIRTKW